MLKRQLILLCLFLQPAMAHSEEVSHYPLRKGSFYKVYSSPCQLELAPTYKAQFQETPLHLCLQGKSFLHSVVALSPSTTKVLYLTDQSLMTSLHVKRSHALHWRGILRVASSAATPGKPLRFDRLVDYAVYQYGKPTLDRVQVSIGRQSLPFGLNQNLAEGFGFWWQPSSFWESPPLATVLSFDNREDLTLQMGVARTFEDASAKDGPTAVSARLMGDISAWHGTRLMLSAYAHQAGERRMGAALLNRAPNGTVSQFEWVRSYSTPDGRQAPFTQLFRLGVQGGRSGKRQSYFQYEDERAVSRLAVLGQYYYVIPRLRINLALIYRRDVNARQVNWGLTLGLGAFL